MEKLTHANYPESRAKHWCTETYQRFGDAIYLLSQSRPEQWQKGWTIYFDELYNWFLPEEWDKYMDRVNEYQKANGVCTIREMLIEIGERMKAAGGLKKCVPRKKPISMVMPGWACLQEMIVRKENDIREEEQLSLF